MTSPDPGPGRRQFTPDFLTELFQNPLDPGYADAAARRARDGGPTGWRRQVATVVLVATLVALGFLLVVRSTLVEQVQRRRSVTDGMQARADALREEVSGLRERELGGPAVARLRNLEAMTGLARVHGDGAQVTLTDGATPIDPVSGKRDLDARVQDKDLQIAANGLWAGGAEAVSINGQRLTATSTIRQAGEAILVDFRPVASPYEVVGIGPDDLAGKFREGYAGHWFRQLSAKYGMSIDVRGVSGVTLSAAAELRLRFAGPSTPPPTPSDAAGTGAPPGFDPSTSAGTASPAGPPSTPSEGG
jgi:uncharacterized protein YlxW (UPF0749 family)